MNSVPASSTTWSFCILDCVTVIAASTIGKKAISVPLTDPRTLKTTGPKLGIYNDTAVRRAKRAFASGSCTIQKSDFRSYGSG